MMLYASNVNAKDDLLARTYPLRPSGVPCVVPMLSFGLFPLRSKHSAAPPTAGPNDNNVAVMRYSGQARPKNITTYDLRRNEYDRRSDVLLIEASNARSTVRNLCTRFSCVGYDMTVPS
jgi:hypothetical protein